MTTTTRGRVGIVPRLKMFERERQCSCGVVIVTDSASTHYITCNCGRVYGPLGTMLSGSAAEEE